MYPAPLTFKMRRERGTGDLWVVENSITVERGFLEPPLVM
jgi:hypothetical protein